MVASSDVPVEEHVAREDQRQLEIEWRRYDEVTTGEEGVR
jgi:hypothetical protein